MAIRRIRSPCCAAVRRGHAAAPPPRRVMNSRRRISKPQPMPRSEIWLVRMRHGGVLSGVIFVTVVGTDEFRPLPEGRGRLLIDDARRPRRREDAFIFDGELQLETLAFVAGIRGKARIG